jgi:hypothetical protein
VSLRNGALYAALVVMVVMIPIRYSYAASPGMECSKVGVIAQDKFNAAGSSNRLVCVKIGKKLLWKVKGGFTAGQTNSGAKSTDKFIVANPVDLQHVTQLSKFRSCVGHDFSNGMQVPGHPLRPSTGALESGRSMKHYVYIGVLPGDTGIVKGYAPFDGTVSIEIEQFPMGVQVIVQGDNGWRFRFFHGDAIVKEGARVKAGDSVIAWPSIDAKMNKGPSYSFDIALESLQENVFESPLTRMAPNIAALWAAKGFTSESAILSKEYRDAKPCKIVDANGTFDQNVGVDPNDMVSAIK